MYNGPLGRDYNLHQLWEVVRLLRCMKNKMATPIEESNDGLECFTFAYQDNNQVADLIKFELHVSQDVADLLREGNNSCFCKN